MGIEAGSIGDPGVCAIAAPAAQLLEVAVGFTGGVGVGVGATVGFGVGVEVCEAVGGGVGACDAEGVGVEFSDAAGITIVLAAGLLAMGTGGAVAGRVEIVDEEALGSGVDPPPHPVMPRSAAQAMLRIPESLMLIICKSFCVVRANVRKH